MSKEQIAQTIASSVSEAFRKTNQKAAEKILNGAKVIDFERAILNLRRYRYKQHSSLRWGPITTPSDNAKAGSSEPTGWKNPDPDKSA